MRFKYSTIIYPNMKQISKNTTMCQKPFLQFVNKQVNIREVYTRKYFSGLGIVEQFNLKIVIKNITMM